MGNWNRHFVRADANGNLGIFDNTGFESVVINSKNNDENYLEITLNTGTGSSGRAGFIELINSSQLAIGGSGGNGQLIGSGWNLPTFDAIAYPFTQYNQITTSMNAFGVISGSPDLRTGVTAADTSAITIFSSTQSGTRYEVKARILATAGTSATYKIVWTEGGVAQSVSLTITAVDTEVHDNFVIAPNAGTDVTAQITSLTSSTVNVDAIVSVLG